MNKKAIKSILLFISEYCELKREIPKKGNFKKEKIKEKFYIIYHDRFPIFFEYNGKYFPNIKLIKIIKKNKVFVDQGAIKYIINGADIMAPGITNYDDKIKKEDIVFVLDDKNKTLLSIGISLVDLNEKPEKGKIIKNLHFIGDKYWKENY